MITESKNNNSGNTPPDEPPVVENDSGTQPPGKIPRKKRSFWKRLLSFILYFFVIIILIPPSLGLLFNNPMVQSLSGRLATSIFSDIVGNKTSIEAIKIDLRGRITLRGVLLKDLHDKTMIEVKYLRANPVFVDWFVVGMVFSKLELDGVIFRFARYEGDDDYNLRMLINSFNSTDTTKSKSSGPPFKLRTKKLFLTNSTFHFYDENRHYDNPGGMDYANIKFDSINLTATRFRIINDSLSFRIDSMSTVEHSGVNIRHMSTDQFIVSSTTLRADSLLLNFDRTQLDLDFGFNYQTYLSYAYFLDSVEIVANIRPSFVRVSDIGTYADELDVVTNKVGITGQVKGTVRNIEGKNLRLHYGEHTRLVADAHIKGLPDFYTSHIVANISDISTSSCELKKINLPIKQKNLDFTEYIDCDNPVSASIIFDGYFNDFKSVVEVRTKEGVIDADVSYTNIENDTLHFDLILQGDTVQIGKLLKMEDLLGNVNLDMNLKGYGHSFDDALIEGSGTLFSMDFNGYNYSRIRFAGLYKGDSVTGQIRVGDQHLMMSAAGSATLSAKPELKINADIIKADLDNLNMWSSQDFRIETKAYVSLKGFDLDEMLASIKLNNSTLTFGEDYYKIREISLDKSISDNGIHNLNFESDFAKLTLSGNYQITTFPGRLINLLDHYLDAIPKISEDSYPANEYAYLTVVLNNTDLIDEQFVPGLKISTPTKIDSHLKFDENNITLKSEIEDITFQGMNFRDNRLDVATENNYINLEFKSKNLIFRDSTESDKTVFGLDDFRILANSGYDSLSYGFYWDNQGAELKNYGNVEGYFAQSPKSSRFKIEQLDISVNDTIWGVNPDNMLLIDSAGTWFRSMNIFGGVSSINLQGKYPSRNGDTLLANFNQWNLSNLDIVTQLFNFDLDGIVNGDVELSMVHNNPTIVSDLRIEGLALNKEYLGETHILNTWDNTNNSIFIKSQVIRSGASGRGEVISLDGYYFPFRDEEAINLNIAFNRFKLVAIESFVSDFVTEIEGIASGELKLTGTISKPVITGKIEANRAAMRINYLNTKYSFSNNIYLEPDRINFNELVIYDELGNSANVDGFLRHTYFDDSEFDLSIYTDKLMFFNTTSKMNDLYYGKAVTSGNIKLSGSPNNVKMVMDVETQTGTDVSLPLDYSVEISDKDYIIFVEPEIDSSEFDLYELEKQVKTKSEELAYDIDLRMRLTPRGKITIFMPSDMGRIEAVGRGNLRLKTNSKGDFNIIGDYTVEDGLFHFSLASLVSKRFELVRGGRISWTGDPYDANVNIRGLYRVRTSLSSLGIVIDSSTNFRNRVVVECYVIVKNQLMNPDIEFDIRFPGLNPDLQRLVYSELDTTNKAVMNEQMISLLVLGTFNLSNASNVTVGSAPYNVLANQLSNMLSKISDDFDIGVNYRPGDQTSQEEFELALSTQLLDDRLIIEGQFGMTYDRSTQDASNLVGDVDVGYKITEDGRWILKAFNHSNVNSWYNYSNFDQVAPYTQGVGIAFRKDFTPFADLFKRTRPKKEKKKKKNKNDTSSTSKIDSM